MFLLLERVLLIIFFVLLPGISNAKYVPDIRIEHSPPAALLKGERIHIKARIIAPNGLIEVRCYFKYDAGNSYLFVEMTNTEQGFECWLPAPASNIPQVEYVFVAVDSMSHVVKSNIFHASLEGDPEDQAVPSGRIESPLFVKSDIPVSTKAADGIASTDRPIYTVVSSNKQYGLQVAIYDLSQDPGYGYGFFGGFEIAVKNQEITPVRGYRAFPVSASSKAGMLLSTVTSTGSYPDITGTNWTGYFYSVDNHGTLLSDKIPVTASVYHDGSGNVTIEVSNHQCPGQDSFSHGKMDTLGYILIYDDCDGEIWTTHTAPPATSTEIYIMDYTDPPFYKKLNEVDLTRPDPNPPPVAPTLVSPPDGASTNSRKTLLEWNAANHAAKYQVQRGSSCDAGGSYETTSLSYALIDIEPDVVNYWKVRGQNSVGIWGPWSSCWSFTTQPNCPACPGINSLLMDE